MNFLIDSAAKTNAGLVCPTRTVQGEPRLRANIQPSGRLGALDKQSAVSPVNSPEEEPAQDLGQGAKDWVKRYEEAQAKLAILRGSKKAPINLGWLARDPSEWEGRKIRHRPTGKVYTIRSVRNNGQVELEKSWMMYWSNTLTIRAEFETYS